MKVSKTFLLILRVVFILFSLQFISDAFYKWDGYSFYLRFSDFLPDLSLSFVLWTIPALPLSVILLAAIYVFSWAVRVVLKNVRIEHALTLFALAATLLAVKMTFLRSVPLTSITGLGHTALIIIITAAALFFTWAMRGNTDKILSEFSLRTVPLAWFFAVMLVIAIPLSFLNRHPHAAGKASGTGVQSGEHKERYPNIILVVIDTLTAVDMDVYGYGRPTTPFISQWAKGSVLFNKAYASSNWTSPTVMSLMTGQRPWTHGIWYMTNRHAKRQYENNLPRVLVDNGYDVYAFVQNRYAHPDTLGIRAPFKKADSYHTFWISSKWWFDRIAAVFADRNVVKEWIFENNGIAELLHSLRPGARDTLFPSENVYDSFLDFMSRTDRDAGSPFFAWLQLYPPHAPYLPPEPYRGIFGDADRFNTDKEQRGSGLIETGYGLRYQADVDILRKRYDEFILYSDREFESFISRLTETLDMSNTIIILTGDHGESFAHGYQGHSGKHLYESIVHVPLMIKLPGGISSGRVVDMRTEQTDIAPTILELSGIPVPKWIEGRSLTPLIEGKTFDPAPVFSMQFIENRALGEPITKGTIAVWDGDYKLVHYLEEGISLLFNIRNDPDELLDIINEKPEKAKELKMLIDRGLSGANAEIVGSGKNK